MQYLGNAEEQIEVAVHAQLRQGNNRGFARFLVDHFVLPVENAEPEILVEPGVEYLYDRALLLGQAIIVEVDVVLYVFDSYIQFGAPPLDAEFATHTHATGFPEVVVPHEVVRGVALVEIGGLDVFEETVGFQLYGIVPQTEPAAHVGRDIDVTDDRTGQTEFAVYVISEQFAFLFRQLAAYPQQTFAVAAGIGYVGPRGETFDNAPGR